MARPIRSIDVYLPLDYNDGRPIPEAKHISVQQELLHSFGGVTSIQRRFPLHGVWKLGETVYHDRVVIFNAMDFREWTQLECLHYLVGLKQRLRRKFDQLEILITVAELLAI